MDKKSKSERRNKLKLIRKRVIKWETIILVVGILTVMVALFNTAYINSKPSEASLGYNEFWDMVEQDKIESVTTIKTQEYVNVVDKEGNRYIVTNPGHDEFKKELLESNVKITTQYATQQEALSSAVTSVPMIIIVYVFIYYMMKTMAGQSTTLYKMYKAEEVVTFKDVAGMSGTKEEVMFAVSQLKNASKLKDVGAKPCKGIILEGPPGTGKTLLAKAIAGEAGVPFINTNGASFVEMFAGLGAARVRRLWELASMNAPCVLFIDEIDAIGRKRVGSADGGSLETNQTLNEILSKMDGLDSTKGIFVIAATNRIEDLDPALIRPGRFDKRLFIGPPKTKKDRDEIVSVHAANKKFEEGVTIDAASKLMFGMSGAEIESVLNESVLISLASGREGIISLNDIDDAVMKLRSSGGVKTQKTSGEDLKIVSVHEAGHALVSLMHGKNVSKVSITPYSNGVGGMTVRDTDDLEGKFYYQKNELLKEIDITLAGMCAEKIIFNDTSSGCTSDLQKATKLAYSILYNFGMDDTKLVSIDALKENGILAIDKHEIFEDVNKLLLERKSNVLKILEDSKDKLILLSNKLIEEENIFELDLDSLKLENAKSSDEAETTTATTDMVES